MSSRRAIKIMMGVTVMLVVAALIEGNLTRHTEIGDLPRAGFIASCLGFVVFYYGWYPFYKAKKGFKNPLREAHLPPDRFVKIDYFKIKNSGEIFGDTFLFFKRNMSFYLWSAAIVAFVYCVLNVLSTSYAIEDVFKLETNPLQQWQVVGQFFMNDKIPTLPYTNGLAFATLAFLVFRILLRGERDETRTRQQNVIDFLKLTAISTIIMLIASMGGFGNAFIFLGFLPFAGLWMYLTYRDRMSIVTSIKHTGWLMSSDYQLSFSTYYIMLLIGYLFYSFMNSAIMLLYLWIFGWNLSFLTTTSLDNWAVLMTTFIGAFSLFLNFMYFFTAMVFLHYSLLEINEANSLLNKIKQIGMGKKIQGMARE
jgi:hypothetical protein